LNLIQKLIFSKGTKVKVNVWSPKAGAKILKWKCQHPKDGNGNPTVFCRG
jgi:hypothetical protein